jgi:hypothetical protein
LWYVTTPENAPPLRERFRQQQKSSARWWR